MNILAPDVGKKKSNVKQLCLATNTSLPKVLNILANIFHANSNYW